MAKILIFVALGSGMGTTVGRLSPDFASALLMPAFIMFYFEKSRIGKVSATLVIVIAKGVIIGMATKAAGWSLGHLLETLRPDIR